MGGWHKGAAGETDKARFSIATQDPTPYIKRIAEALGIE